jgi:hypothetical protein
MSQRKMLLFLARYASIVFIFCLPLLSRMCSEMNPYFCILIDANFYIMYKIYPEDIFWTNERLNLRIDTELRVTKFSSCSSMLFSSEILIQKLEKPLRKYNRQEHQLGKPSLFSSTVFHWFFVCSNDNSKSI